MKKQELMAKMKSDPRFTDVEDNGDITFRLVSTTIYAYFWKYCGYDVIWNDCEGYEDEGQVNIT